MKEVKVRFSAGLVLCSWTTYFWDPLGFQDVIESRAARHLWPCASIQYNERNWRHWFSSVDMWKSKITPAYVDAQHCMCSPRWVYSSHFSRWWWLIESFASIMTQHCNIKTLFWFLTASQKLDWWAWSINHRHLLSWVLAISSLKVWNVRLLADGLHQNNFLYFCLIRV